MFRLVKSLILRNWSAFALTLRYSRFGLVAGYILYTLSRPNRLRLDSGQILTSYRSCRLVTILLCFSLHLGFAIAEAAPRRGSSDFVVPEKLRPRVDFWKDVFTRYGKAQMVVHHRDFPQVRFGVIDLTREFEVLSKEEFDKLKTLRGNQEIDRLKSIFISLAAGNGPRTIEEERIMQSMRFLPGGLSKYKTVIDQDLVRTQTGIKEKYQEAVRRSGRYLPIMESIFKEAGLPVELTRLPFIESSFDYEAYSSVGAAGIWQFMRRTAMSYMTVNSLVDERRDPIEATRAAARYLEQAYATLGTWPLALTSYNHGVAGVARKVRQMGTSNLVDIIEDPYERAFGFASSNFYPEFLAALEIYQNYQEYFPGLELYPALKLTQYRLPKAMPIKSLANRFAVPLEELKKVNYAISEKVWSGRALLPRAYTLKIPARYETKIAAIHLPSGSEAGTPLPSASAIYGGKSYIVRKGDTLLSVAKKFGITVAKLKSINQFDSNHIAVGQTIIISAVQDRRINDLQESSTTRKYKVKAGDNLWLVARKLGVTVQDLKAANKLKKNEIRVGQVLRVR